MEDKKRVEKNTKALLYWLRHHPAHIGLKLDKGWANINSIVECSQRKHKMSLEDIKEVVESDNKDRFEIQGKWSKIKSKEGHTNVKV
jgi:putative RNA 2'-phosphotransferase